MARSERDARDGILESAQELMAQKGYSAVGLTEVLSAARVPKGSFYYYFDSKDSFGVAMLQSYFSAYVADMDRLSTSAGRTSADQLMAYWQSFYDKQVIDDCQGRCLVVKLAAEVSDLSEAMRAVLKTGTAEIISRIAAMVDGGVADGSLSFEGDPASVAGELYAEWLGASLLAKVNREPSPLDRAMALTAGLLHL